jgi:hypothetical protein
MEFELGQKVYFLEDDYVASAEIIKIANPFLHLAYGRNTEMMIMPHKVFQTELEAEKARLCDIERQIGRLNIDKRNVEEHIKELEAANGNA